MSSSARFPVSLPARIRCEACEAYHGPASLCSSCSVFSVPVASRGAAWVAKRPAAGLWFCPTRPQGCRSLRKPAAYARLTRVLSRSKRLRCPRASAVHTIHTPVRSKISAKFIPTRPVLQVRLRLWQCDRGDEAVCKCPLSPVVVPHSSPLFALFPCSILYVP